jgi:hypothetical protein
MKRFLPALAVGVSALAAIAGPISTAEINYHNRKAFLTEFGHVRNVQWLVTTNYLLRASFTLDGQEAADFF